MRYGSAKRVLFKRLEKSPVYFTERIGAEVSGGAAAATNEKPTIAMDGMEVRNCGA